MAYDELQKLVDESSRIVFFGGAGVSTESGIPDFRSVDGLYNQKYESFPTLSLFRGRKNSSGSTGIKCFRWKQNPTVLT